MLAIVLLVVAIVFLITVTVVEMVLDKIGEEDDGDEVVSGAVQGTVSLTVEAPRRIDDG